MSNKYWCSPDCKACASGIYCSCGVCEFCYLEYWATLNSIDLKGHNFCPYCGDKLLPDGTVESRAEVERKAAVVDGLLAGKTICYFCCNVNYCMDPATSNDISCDRGNGFKLK